MIISGQRATAWMGAAQPRTHMSYRAAMEGTYIQVDGLRTEPVVVVQPLAEVGVLVLTTAQTAKYERGNGSMLRLAALGDGAG
jgi:hypothetical protein